MTDDSLNEIPKFIRRVMPEANEAELREATETFKQYMAIVLRVYERVKQERLGSDSPDGGSCGRVDSASHAV